MIPHMPPCIQAGYRQAGYRQAGYRPALDAVLLQLAQPYSDHGKATPMGICDETGNAGVAQIQLACIYSGEKA
jgi:hypothetical protein